MSEKCHNRAASLNAKVELRKNVLFHVKPSRVLDCFCGPTGEMWKLAWADADSYLGIDEEWRISDSRRRMACDNRLALRCLDLYQFNVFDFDAFGSPWEQVLIWVARRKWAPGEQGAVILTDGSGMKARFGKPWPVLTQLTGITGMTAPTEDGAERIHELAVAAMLEKMRVTPVKRWKAYSARGGKGSAPMRYTAIVFEGVQTARDVC